MAFLYDSRVITFRKDYPLEPQMVPYRRVFRPLLCIFSRNGFPPQQQSLVSDSNKGATIQDYLAVPYALYDPCRKRNAAHDDDISERLGSLLSTKNSYVARLMALDTRDPQFTSSAQIHHHRS